MGLVLLSLILTLLSLVVGWLMKSRGVLACCLVATLLVVVSFWGSSFRNEHWATCTVISKDRGGNDGSYRVNTKECGVLANKDTWLRAKVNSADVWSVIPQQGPVRLKIVGSRISLLSQFPNILEAKPVS